MVQEIVEYLYLVRVCISQTTSCTSKGGAEILTDFAATRFTASSFTELKNEAIVFIKQRCRVVMKTEGWKKMSKSLVEEVLMSTVNIDIDPKRQKLS